jgi:putative ABC transport system ATP-binding protein
MNHVENYNPNVRRSSSDAAGVLNGSKIYGAGDSEVRALDNVTVGFEKGCFTAIMGPSGSGKSTLMHCAAGLDRLSSGTAHIGGSDLSALSDHDLTLLRRRKVGFIFQSFNLLPALTAAENIVLPVTIGGEPVDVAVFDRVIDVLGLRSRLDHRPSQLSGGQQQRVAVARALVSQPEIIFGDEPTGNLDSQTGAEILGFLRRTVDTTGQTIAMVTHDPTAASYADRVIFVKDGRIVDEMTEPTSERVYDVMKALGR